MSLIAKRFLIDFWLACNASAKSGVIKYCLCTIWNAKGVHYTE